MKRKLASIQRIKSIESIPNADTIEKATILGWEVAVKKGQFNVGDLCVYFEIDSLLPLNNNAFNSITQGKKTNTVLVDTGLVVEGYRLKPIRLRGQVSQGLALNIEALEELKSIDIQEGMDVTELLGIHKYEAPESIILNCPTKGIKPLYIKETGETRVQTIPHIFEEYKYFCFYVTEKLDGMAISIYSYNGEFGICSRNLELKQNDETVIWKFFNALDLKNKLRGQNIVIQGEFIGEKINGNNLLIKGHDFYVYNIYGIRDDGTPNNYYNIREMQDFCTNINVKVVPILDLEFILPKTDKELLEYVDCLKSSINPMCKPEGIVVRSNSHIYDDIIGGRLSFKAIHPNYLLNSKE